MKKSKARKLPKKSTLKRKADKLFSLIVRNRKACQMCNKLSPTIQCAHVISRSNLHLRYDLRNALCLCAGCHLKWHHEPLWAITWYQNVYPDDYAYLMKERLVIESNIDYNFIIKRLNNMGTK